MALVNNLKHQLYVVGLSYGTDDQSLREAFSKYGEVVEARVRIDPVTGQSTRFGVVTLTSSMAAADAISSMDGRYLHGREIEVGYFLPESKIIPIIHAFKTEEWKQRREGRGHLHREEERTRVLNANREQGEGEGEQRCTISIDVQRHVILSRIPASSLIRFRLACKLWHDLTYDPSFIDSQLEHARSRPKSDFRLIVLSRNRDRIDRNDGEITLMDEAMAPKIGFPVTCNDLYLSRSCNGLVCLYDNYDSVLLFNPTTRERLYLPPAYDGKHRSDIPRCCLGFLPSTKEYKVVRFAHRRGNSYRCEVFTLGTSSWRKICNTDLQPFGRRGVAVDGMMYWSQCYANMILAFDLKDEKLMSISPPKLPDFQQRIELFEVEGSLCLMSYQLHDYPASMEVWMLKDVTKNAWIRRHSAAGRRWRWITKSCLCFSEATPVLLHKGKLLVESRGRLHWDDLQAEHPRLQMVDPEGQHGFICGASAYEESLVSLERWRKA